MKHIKNTDGLAAGSSSYSNGDEAMSVDGEVDGRGSYKGPRQKRLKRDPYKSFFWVKYIKRAIDANPDNETSIWEETSPEGAQFRRRFGLPYVIFNDIAKRWSEKGEYRNKKDRVGNPRVDARILILGVIRILAKGSTFDLIDEMSDVSYQYH